MNKMKIAITATGNTMEATVDHRFGRCSHFVFYDQGQDTTEFIPNPHREAPEGAGRASVMLVANHGAGRVISGDFGMKIRSLLDQLKIDMVIVSEPGKEIRDVIGEFHQHRKAMPHLNGSGPEGKGSGSGRRLGKAAGKDEEELLQELGKGQGKRRKAGGGQGRGRRARSGKL